MIVKTRFAAKRINPSRKLTIPTNQGMTIQRSASGCAESRRPTPIARTVNRTVNKENSTKCAKPSGRLQRVGANLSDAQYKIAKLMLVKEQNQSTRFGEKAK